MIRKILLSFVFMILLIEVSYGEEKGTMLRVTVWDDTDKNPLPVKSEIWFRGHGSWWLKRELKHGATAKKLGRRTVGKKSKLYLYLDGRKGKEIIIPIVMTKEMNTESSDRDSVIINVSDTVIEVIGLALILPKGKKSFKFKRK